MPNDTGDDVPDDIAAYLEQELATFFETRTVDDSDDNGWGELVVSYQTTRGSSLIGPQFFRDLEDALRENAWNLGENVQVLPTHDETETVDDPFGRDIDVTRVLPEHGQFAVYTGRDSLPAGELQLMRETVIDVLESYPETEQERINDDRLENPSERAIVSEHVRVRVECYN